MNLTDIRTVSEQGQAEAQLRLDKKNLRDGCVE